MGKEWVLAAFPLSPFSTLAQLGIQGAGSARRPARKRDMTSVSILDTCPQSRKDIHGQVLFLHGQNLLYLLPFIYFSLMQNKGKDILGGWVYPKRKSSTHASPSFTPPPASTQPLVRGLPRGVGTDKRFHGCLVHRA